MRQSGKCHLERASKRTCYKFSPLPYDSHNSQGFANLIQGPEESLVLYMQ